MLYIRVLLSVSAAVQQEANWQERCWCHSHLFDDSPKGFQERLADYRRASARCPWKGCRAAELAAGHWRTHVHNIRHYRTRELHDLCFEARPEDRSLVVSLETNLKQCICEQLDMKLSPWGQLPLRLIGIY
eukprot:4811073-Pyramimonas_sp.AAC.1